MNVRKVWMTVNELLVLPVLILKAVIYVPVTVHIHKKAILAQVCSDKS